MLHNNRANSVIASAFLASIIIGTGNAHADGPLDTDEDKD